MERLISVTQNKREHRRAFGVLMQAHKKRVIDIARELDVSIDALERWLRS